MRTLVLVQTLVAVAEDTDDVIDGIEDVCKDKEVSGELGDFIEVACEPPCVATSVKCWSCNDTITFEYLRLVAIRSLSQRL